MVGGGRGLLAIVGGIAVLLVATVAIVLFAGNRPPQAYPTGSPEAAVQGYLRAWESDDLAAAWQFFSTGARAGTTFEDYQRHYVESGAFGHPGVAPSRRVYIDRTTINGARAEVALTIEETWVQGLSASRSRYSQTMPLVSEAGAWRFERLFFGLEMAYFEKEPTRAE